MEACIMLKVNPIIFLFSVIGGIVVYMGLFTWSELPKDQSNPQLISEAITEAINNHEADPQAHLGAGESLEQHKSNEVIDHPAFSILGDKNALDRFVVDVPFTNLDLFDHGSNVEIQGYNTFYYYASGLNHTEWLNGYLGDTYLGAQYEFDRNPRFLTNFMISSISNCTVYIIVGETDDGRGFGFKVVNGVLYGIYYKADFSEQAVNLQTLIQNTPYKVEARVNYPNNIEFYVNNLLKGSFQNPVLPYPMNFGLSIPWTSIKRTASGASELFLSGFHFEADYPS